MLNYHLKYVETGGAASTSVNSSRCLFVSKWDGKDFTRQFNVESILT